MAYKKKYKRLRRRLRRYKRHKKGNKATAHNYATSLGKYMPTRLFKEFETTVVVPLSTSLYSYYWWNLFANNLHDPMGILGNTLPTFAIQLADIYNRYHIRACKVDITVTNHGSEPVWLILYANDEVAGIADRRYYNWEAIPPNRRSSIKLLGTGGSVSQFPSKRISKYFDFKKCINNYQRSDVDYSGSAEGAIGGWVDPVKPVYVGFGICSENNITGPNIVAKITLTQYCELYDPSILKTALLNQTVDLSPYTTGITGGFTSTITAGQF